MTARHARVRHILSIAGAVLSLLAVARVAGSQESDDDARARKELQDEVRRLRAVESRYGRERSTVLGDINHLDLSIVRGAREIELTSDRLREGRRESDRLEQERVALARDHASQRRALSASLRAAYQRRMPGWMASLLSADHPSQLRRELNALGKLSDAQAAGLADYARKTRALDAAERSLAASNAEVEALRDALARKQTETESSRAARRAALSRLDTRKAEAVAELKQAATKLSHLVDDFSVSRALPPETGFADRRRRLPWPVDAPIRKKFGTFEHPRFRTKVAHDGIELDAAVGTPVRAVHGGQVAYADWFKGYGYMVVLDHGGGYYSLYAHLGRCSVSRGTDLTGGSIVGVSGETGALDGPGLYFEIRRGSTALNPERWLRKR